jgi:hypothetical protein
MIQVPVREQDAGQALEAGARLQDLALCALSAIHKKAVFVMADDSG